MKKRIYHSFIKFDLFPLGRIQIITTEFRYVYHNFTNYPIAQLWPLQSLEKFYFLVYVSLL